MRNSTLRNGPGAILRRLGRDRSGTVITWVAASIVPLLVSVGLASDIARGFVLRSELSSALDAAALAGGRVFNADNRDEIIQQYFDANFPEDFLGSEVGELEIEAVSTPGEPDRLRVSASADMPTLFMRLVGFETFDVGTAAEVTRRNLGLQLAMVLDHTGSMDGSKIADLEDASLELIDILFGNETSGEHDLLNVAIIPYSAAVNVGDLGDAFIDKTDIPPEIFSNGNEDRRWKGCVQARDTFAPLSPDITVLDAGAHDISVEPPAAGGKWRPYLYPHWYDNQYKQLPFADDMDPTDPGQNAGSNIDDVEDAFAYRQGKGPFGEIWPLPDTDLSLGNDYTGPNIGCPARVLPFSNEHSVITDYIENNTHAWFRGGTIGSQGLVWGWRMLDPGAPFPNPVAYNDPTTVKALIMMTDGKNEIWRKPLNQYEDRDGDGIRVKDSDYDANDDDDDASDRPLSDYTAYGRLDHGRLGTTNVNEAAERVNLRMAKICHAMKAGGTGDQDKIIIYTVIFGNEATASNANSEALRDLYRECASKPANAFLAPSGADLQEAFETIGNDLANLHLSR